MTYYTEVYQCPSYATALGYMGVVAAVTLSNMGSAVRVNMYMRYIDVKSLKTMIRTQTIFLSF